MLKSSDVIGKSVITEETGEQLTKVQDVIFDSDINRMLGFVVDEGSQFKETRVMLWEGVQLINSEMILLSSAKYIIPADHAPPIKQIMQQESSLKRAKVVTTEGDELGTLIDVYFDEQTGQVEGYEISAGLVADAAYGRSFLPISLVIEVGQEVALVKPEAADFLETNTGPILIASRQRVSN